MKATKKHIAVIGLGHIGLPILAVLASRGHNLIGIDTDQVKLQRLQETFETDIHEPGLNELLKLHKSNITFTSEYRSVEVCDAVFIAVGTPLNERGTPNYDYLDSALEIGKYIKMGCKIILKSTVMPGTTRNYVVPKLEMYSGKKAARDFYVAFCPERMVEGRALQELTKLPKIVGGIDHNSMKETSSVISELGGKIIAVSSPEIAELAKLMDNTFRTMNIAFSNELTMLCEHLSIDAREVIKTVNDSYERNNIFLPGLGADGPCLLKDSQSLRYYAEQNNFDLKIINACIDQSKTATLRIADMVLDFINAHKLKQTVISILGLAFKGHPPTGDCRGAPAEKIYNALKSNANESELIYKFYDPIVSNFHNNAVCNVIDDCLTSSNVVLFLTNTPQLLNIDMNRVLNHTSRPLLIIDCWQNIQRIETAKRGTNVQLFQVGQGWNVAESKKLPLAR